MQIDLLRNRLYTILLTPGVFLLNIFLINITCNPETSMTARHSKNDHHLTAELVDVTADPFQ